MGISIPSTVLTQFNAAISAILDSNLVSQVTLYYPPKVILCINCSGTRGTYNGTGPIPFSGGICPYCSGTGQVTTSTTESLQGGLYRTPKEFSKIVPSHISVNFPEGVVVFKTYASNLPKLMRAQYLVFSGQLEQKYIKYKESIPSGFGDSNFCLTFWQRSQ